MPTPTRRARGAKKKLTLGFIGAGELSQKAVFALLDDIGEVEKVIIPVSDADYSDEIGAVFDWAQKQGTDVALIAVAPEQIDDKELDDVLDACDEVYAPADGSNVTNEIIALLAGGDSEDDYPTPDDGRLLFFYDPEVAEDVSTFEAALDAGITCYDMCDSLSEMVPSDDEPEPEPEPEKPARRTRGARAAAPAEDEEPASQPSVPAKADLLKMTLAELKTVAEKADPETNTKGAMRGLGKDAVIDLILVTGSTNAEAAEEKPAAAVKTPRRGRAAASTPDEGDEAQAEALGATKDTQRAETLGNLASAREQAQGIAVGIHAVINEARSKIEDGADESAVIAGALGASIAHMVEHVLYEIRKPRSAGRPRKDGTAAQARPKDETPDEETPAPRTRRRRSAS